MSASPLAFRIAQAVGFTGAAWLSGLSISSTAGNIAALNMNAAPGILASKRENDISSATLAKQWRKVFEAGKAQNPPIAAITSSAFFYVAWCARAGSPMFVRSVPSHAVLYCTAAALAMAIVPYTLTAMRKTNNALVEVSTSTSAIAAKNDGEVEHLVEDWISLNRIRSLFPLAGGIVAVFASLA